MSQLFGETGCQIFGRCGKLQNHQICTYQELYGQSLRGLVIYEYDNKLFTDNCVALWAPIYGRVLVKYRPYSSYMMLRYVETSEAFWFHVFLWHLQSAPGEAEVAVRFLRFFPFARRLAGTVAFLAQLPARYVRRAREGLPLREAAHVLRQQKILNCQSFQGPLEGNLSILSPFCHSTIKCHHIG